MNSSGFGSVVTPNIMRSLSVNHALLMTGGQGSYTMEFSHYDVVPGNVQQQIIAQAKVKEEEE